MRNQRAIIHRPVITEKATALRESNTYTFRVDGRANKIEIRRAIESVFGVHVESIRTLSVPRKPKRQGVFQGYRAGWKKAYVTLRTGETIAALENIG